MPRRRVASLLAAIVIATAGCSSGTPEATHTTSTTATSTTTTSIAAPPPSAAQPSSGQPCGVIPSPTPRVQHVIWIWMENHQARSVFGHPDAPFENDLKAQCGSSSTYEAVGSPSLPNYLGATSGDTHGVHDDAAPAKHPLDTDNLFRQARTAGLSSRSYEEAMTSPCQLASSGRYAVKHNPAAYYVGADDRSACERDDIPFGDLDAGALAHDLDDDTLAAFSFITPDLCNDTHDCPIADGDAWLSQCVPRILDSAAYRAGATILFIVWDEPTPMPLLVIGPSVAPGTDANEPFSHYSLLRTTEELLGLPLLGQAQGAASMRSTFNL